MTIQINVSIGRRSLGRYPVYSTPISLGRSSASDIRIPSALLEVSSKHMLLKEQGGVLWMMDGNGSKASTNGVYINGSRISPNIWIKIDGEELVSLGDPNNTNCVHISVVRQVQKTLQVSTEAKSAIQLQPLTNHAPRSTLTSEKKGKLKTVQDATPKSQPRKTISETGLNSVPSSFNIQLSEEEEDSMSNVIEVLKNGYSFQTIDVLERIVAHEQEKIENEQALWRIGGAILGAVLGAGDGFDLTDVGTSFAFSNIAGMAHSQASKEQRQFLKKLHSLWLIDQRSPVDLRRRLGEPIGRFIGYNSEARTFDYDEVFFANVHQNSSRGFTFVALGLAEDFASGFTNEMSREKLIEVFTNEELETLRYQLYPITDASVPLKLVRAITDAEAKDKDPMYSSLRKVGSPYRLSTGDGDDQIVYKCSIPSHSDY